MQKITEQQIKTIAKEIVKLSKNNDPIKHSNVLEVISHSLGYRDYNGLINSLKKVGTPTVDNIDVSSVVREISGSEKILTGIRNIEKELESQKNVPSTQESKKLEQELKTLRRNYSKASWNEDTEAGKKRSEEQRILKEKKQYEDALRKFNNHYYSVLESVSRSFSYKDYNALSNSLKKEVPVSDDGVEYVDMLSSKEYWIKRVIDTIKSELKSKKNSLSEEEIQKIESKLKILNSLHKSVLATYGKAKKELKKCPNCNGEGEFIVGLQHGASNFDYNNYERGNFFAVEGMLDYKECFWCLGRGKISNNRMKQVENLKKEPSYSN